MSTNHEMRKQLVSGRSRFYLCDLHVHTPASFHRETLANFGNLSEAETQAIKNVGAKDLKKMVPEYEKAMLEELPVEQYLKLLAARRDSVAEEHLPARSSDWAIVAATDHCGCEYSAALSCHSWKMRKTHRLIVLPGIELDVTFPVPDANGKVTAHVLCIFAAQTSASDIRMAICHGSNTVWKPGHLVAVDSLPEFICDLRHHTDYPAICVAAHVASGKGVGEQAKTTLITTLDAEIARLEGELRNGVDADVEAIAKRLKDLKEKHGPERISLAVLELIGQCGFDALQVSDQRDARHYRQLHKYRPEFGRAVPITCSDAHTVADVFGAKSDVPCVKLSVPLCRLDENALFEELKQKSLRLGETRFSFVMPSIPKAWISGIRIIPDAEDASRFWPAKTFSADDGADGAGGGPKAFFLPFSPNLNCLIGGRGSGKSAALEAIAFVCEPGQFSATVKKPESKWPDWFTRARATFKLVPMRWTVSGGTAIFSGDGKILGIKGLSRQAAERPEGVCHGWPR